MKIKYEHEKSRSMLLQAEQSGGAWQTQGFVPCGGVRWDKSPVRTFHALIISRFQRAFKPPEQTF